ncbi:MAG: HIRAN domain-containing protein [bacterium]
MSTSCQSIEKFSDTALNPVDTQGMVGFIPTFIVGRHYYTTATPHDGRLLCEREPENNHDGEAIAIYAEAGGHKLGHLPRYDAAVLAPLLDRNAIRIRANVTGPDNLQGRTPIHLGVFPAANFEQVLEGAGGSSADALWHTLMLTTWKQSNTLDAHSLVAFRDVVRDLAHTGKLWPETQLFYRLLKGVVLVREETERKKEELVRQAKMEEERLRDNQLLQERIASTDCEPVGGMLHYGRFAILPLRALQPAECLSLAEALKTSQASILQTCKSAKVQWFVLTASESPRVLATVGECLDTTEGRFYVGSNYLIYPQERRCIKIVPEADVQRQKIVMLKEMESTRPHLPELPDAATGFALFADGELFELALFARHANAAAYYSRLEWGAWQLASTLPPPDVATACEEITYARKTFFELDGHLNNKDYLADPDGNLLRLTLRPLDNPPLLIKEGKEEME